MQPSSRTNQRRAMKRFSSVDDLLDSLIDRLEANAAPTRLVAHVGDFASIAAQDAFMGELAALESAGGLVVDRERNDGVEIVRRVRLADVEVIYRHRGRTPSRQRAEISLEKIRSEAAIHPGLGSIIDEVGNSWARNVAWCTLRPGQSDALLQAALLARALADGSRSGEPPQDYRTFSRRIAGDSKSLERHAGTVVEIVQRLYPDAVPQQDIAPTDLIGHFGVERLPQPLLVGGPICVDGVVLPELPFVGVPPESSSRVSVGEVQYMLLIENYTSFVRHCREVRTPPGLTIYTGGFPSRAVLRAILSFASPGVPTFHWGDIDAGGLRIFAHIETSLAKVGVTLLPHLMSVALLTSLGRPQEASTRRPVKSSMSGSGIAELWDALLDTHLELEQEEIDPSRPTFPSGRVAKP